MTVPQRPRSSLPPHAEPAIPLPPGARSLASPVPAKAVKPLPPPDSLDCTVSATLERGASFGKTHTVYLRLEVERGTLAASRLVNLAESGLLRGKVLTAFVGMSTLEVRS